MNKADIVAVGGGGLVEPERADRHPVTVYLASLTESTRKTMEHSLIVIARVLNGGRCEHPDRTGRRRVMCELCDPLRVPWGALRREHTQAIRTKLAERYEPAGANTRLSALRGVLKEAWLLGQMEAEHYHRAIEIKPVKGEKLPTGRHIKRRELQRLFNACAKDESDAGRRDAAIIAVLYGGGLRRAEVVKLDRGDYDSESGELRIRGGKGRKDRTAYATNGAVDALTEWLDVRGDEPGPLFWPASGRGRPLENGRMSGQAVMLMLRKRAAESKVEPLTPHDFRRTFISDLLDDGADMSTVKELAGHANVNTTARYDRRGEETKRKAAQLLMVPFKKREKESNLQPTD